MWVGSAHLIVSLLVIAPDPPWDCYLRSGENLHPPSFGGFTVFPGLSVQTRTPDPLRLVFIFFGFPAQNQIDWTTQKTDTPRKELS